MSGYLLVDELDFFSVLKNYQLYIPKCAQSDLQYIYLTMHVLLLPINFIVIQKFSPVRKQISRIPNI